MKTIPLSDGRELVFIPVPIGTDKPYLDTICSSYCDLLEIIVDSKPTGTVYEFSKGIQLIGTISGDYEADFDVEPYVNVFIDDDEESAFQGVPFYRDYSKEGRIHFHFSDAKDSFKSLMNANDVWMHNPLDPKPDYDDRDHHFEEDYKYRQDKVVSKYIVLLRETK